MRIRKIVIGGGPCSGKTTALAWLKSDLEGRGYRYVIIPEAATELIEGGVTPWTCTSYDQFQHAVFEMQLAKEATFLHAAEAMDVDEVVVVYDRGVMDNKGYMSAEGFAQLIAEWGFTEEELRSRYDIVFHLVSTAKGALGAYTLENNHARMENPEEAAAVDDRLIAAWKGHPNFHVIYNANEFADKMEKLLKKVHEFLEE